MKEKIIPQNETIFKAQKTVRKRNGFFSFYVQYAQIFQFLSKNMPILSKNALYKRANRYNISIGVIIIPEIKKKHNISKANRQLQFFNQNSVRKANRQHKHKIQQKSNFLLKSKTFCCLFYFVRECNQKRSPKKFIMGGFLFMRSFIYITQRSIISAIQLNNSPKFRTVNETIRELKAIDPNNFYLLHKPLRKNIKSYIPFKY